MLRVRERTNEAPQAALLDPTAALDHTSRGSLVVGFVGIALFVWGAWHLVGEISVFAVTSGLTLFLGALAWGATAR